MRAYFRARATVTTTETRRAGGSIATAPGRRRPSRCLSIWCFLSFSRTHDPFAELVSFTMTVAYAAGIFGRNFANARFVVMQIICTWAADDRGPADLRESVSLDFCRASGPDLSRHQVDSRQTAPHAARRGGHIARHVAARQAVRHRAQQHAARPVHVRRQPPHRRLQPEAQAAGRTAARSRAQGPRRSANWSKASAKAGLLSETQRAKPGRSPRTRSFPAATTPPSPSIWSNGRTLEFTVQPMENGGMVVLVEDITERQDRRGQDQPSGAVRCVDRAAQPQRAARPHGAGAGRMAARQHVRHSFHRSRPVQAGQRHAGPYPRRHASGGGRRAAADHNPRRRRHIRVSAATSLSSCRRRSNRSTRARCWRRACSRRLAAPTISTVTRWSSPPASASRSPKSRSIRSSSCATPTWRSISAKADGRGTWRWFEAKMEAKRPGAP